MAVPYYTANGSYYSVQPSYPTVAHVQQTTSQAVYPITNDVNASPSPSPVSAAAFQNPVFMLVDPRAQRIQQTHQPRTTVTTTPYALGGWTYTPASPPPSSGHRFHHAVFQQLTQTLPSVLSPTAPVFQPGQAFHIETTNDSPDSPQRESDQDEFTEEFRELYNTVESTAGPILDDFEPDDVNQVTPLSAHNQNESDQSEQRESDQEDLSTYEDNSQLYSGPAVDSEPEDINVGTPLSVQEQNESDQRELLESDQEDLSTYEDDRQLYDAMESITQSVPDSSVDQEPQPPSSPSVLQEYVRRLKDQVRSARALRARVERHTQVCLMVYPDQVRACPICLNNVELGQVTRTLPCSHIMHRECVDHWFTSRNTTECPICRTDMTIEDTAR